MQHLVLSIGGLSNPENVEFIQTELIEKIAKASVSMSVHVVIGAANISPKLERLYKAIIANLDKKAGMILRTYFAVNQCSIQMLDIVKGSEEYYIPDDMMVVDLPVRDEEATSSGKEVLRQCMKGRSSVRPEDISVIRFRDFEPSISNVRKVNIGYDADYLINYEMKGVDYKNLILIGDTGLFSEIRRQTLENGLQGEHQEGIPKLAS